MPPITELLLALAPTLGCCAQVAIVQRNSLCPWPATSAILPNSTAQLELSEEAPSCNATLAAPALGALQRGVAEAAALSPVSEPQFCTLKDGAAVKCSMTFRSGDLTEAFVAGQPLYLSFEATQFTEVRSHLQRSQRQAAATTVAAAPPAMVATFATMVGVHMANIPADCVPS